MNTNLVDKLNIEDIEELKKRDTCFRTVINNKIYDTSHEDDLMHYVINNTKFKDMLLIRYEYYLSKTYHGLGKGDMVLYDDKNDKLYALEFKSLKDKYSSTTDSSKITKCIDQSIKYSEYSLLWGSKQSIPVSIIEYLDGKVEIIERDTIFIDNLMSKLDIYTDDIPNSTPIENNCKLQWINKKQDEDISNDKWFTHPGDQTLTKYKISGDTLESERIVDYLPSAGSRKAYRKRVKKVCQECSKCNKYYIILKDIQGNILMQEMHEINDNINDNVNQSSIC